MTVKVLPCRYSLTMGKAFESEEFFDRKILGKMKDLFDQMVSKTDRDNGLGGVDESVTWSSFVENFDIKDKLVKKFFEFLFRELRRKRSGTNRRSIGVRSSMLRRPIRRQQELTMSSLLEPDAGERDRLERFPVQMSFGRAASGTPLFSIRAGPSWAQALAESAVSTQSGLTSSSTSSSSSSSSSAAVPSATQSRTTGANVARAATNAANAAIAEATAAVASAPASSVPSVSTLLQAAAAAATSSSTTQNTSQSSLQDASSGGSSEETTISGLTSDQSNLMQSPRSLRVLSTRPEDMELGFMEFGQPSLDIFAAMESIPAALERISAAVRDRDTGGDNTDNANPP